MGVLSTLSAALTVLLSSFIYHRASILYSFYANAPERLEMVNNLGQYEIRFKHLIRNCEDVYMNDFAGWALLSCDPGRDEWNTVMGTFINPAKTLGTGLFLYRYADGAETTPDMVKLLGFDHGHADFHPLGIEYHAPSQTLFVANHAFSGSKIEVYHFDPIEAAATLTATLEDSQILTPNSIAAVSGTEFLFTNDHYFRVRYNPILAKVETYGGIPGGAIMHVKLLPGGKTEINSLARVSMANGIVLLNSSTVAVASSASAAVFVYNIVNKTLEGGTLQLSRISTITIPFLPDNLSVDENGKLLIAGHPHAPSLEAVAKNNRNCHEDGTECQLHRLSWFAEWSESEGLKTLYTGDEYGTSSTAVRDVERGVGIATGLYERGLLVWTS